MRLMPCFLRDPIEKACLTRKPSDDSTKPVAHSLTRLSSAPFSPSPKPKCPPSSPQPAPPFPLPCSHPTRIAAIETRSYRINGPGGRSFSSDVWNSRNRASAPEDTLPPFELHS